MSELAPATLEGWYALHQVFAVDWGALAARGAADRERLADEVRSVLLDLSQPRAGWSAAFQIVGGGADLMLVHFRETLDELGAAQLRLRRSAVGPLLDLQYDYTSVTEVGLYHATAEAAADAQPRTARYQSLLDEAMAAERASQHVQTRLYPAVPEHMRYVSFYPMSKRRLHPDNWYTLPVAERSRLMQEHGLTGRQYARRVFQVITGSVGLDDWEWGVTLFAEDPLEFKRIVTEMRYDEASARFGEFGAFFTGVRITPDDVAAMLRG